MKNPDDSQSPRLEQPPLFETPADPAGQAPPSEAPSSSGCPRLRTANRQQIVFRTASLDELIPLDHPARIVWDYVEGLDLSPLYDRIKSPIARSNGVQSTVHTGLRNSISFTGSQSRGPGWSGLF